MPTLEGKLRMLSQEIHRQETALYHHFPVVCLRIHTFLIMIKSIEEGFSLGWNAMK